eukprot:458862_1
MSAIQTTVKLFVFIAHIIYTHGERTRFCDAGTDELFYENANNFSATGWSWDDDDVATTNYNGYYQFIGAPANPYCYTEACYVFYAEDFDGTALMSNPSFTSVPISTIDHWNIYIIFSVSTFEKGTKTTGSCATSYTVNNGDDFDEIHSAIAGTATTITRTLGTNAENINNLQIKLWLMNTEIDLKDQNKISCGYDKILICGTAITPAPTASPTSNTALPTSNTASPTSNTALPTSNTASPTSNTALPTSNTGSPSQTPTSNTLPPSVSPTSNTASPTSNTALPTSNTAS